MIEAILNGVEEHLNSIGVKTSKSQRKNDGKLQAIWLDDITCTHSLTMCTSITQRGLVTVDAYEAKLVVTLPLGEWMRFYYDLEDPNLFCWLATTVETGLINSRATKHNTP